MGISAAICVVGRSQRASGGGGAWDLFGSDSGWIRLPGDWARSGETVVSDHQVNHIDPNTYLLWWDDDLIAHLELNKPPSEHAMCHKRNGRWGDSRRVSWVGTISMRVNHDPDRRTMIAADPGKRIIWLAVFDRASYYFAYKTLAEHGAKIGVMVDGGTSSKEAVGSAGRGWRSGTITGNWRPVATQIGARKAAVVRGACKVHAMQGDGVPLPCRGESLWVFRGKLGGAVMQLLGNGNVIEVWTFVGGAGIFARPH